MDTIRVGKDKSTLLTEGMKSTKDFLFFLTPESDDDKPKKTERKAPTQPRANGSPAKLAVAGKVLRNNNRRAAQDDVNELRQVGEVG